MYKSFWNQWNFITFQLVASDLVDLSLKIIDDFWRHLITQNLEQINALVSRDGLVGGQFDAFLDLQDENFRNYTTDLFSD